MLKPNLLEKLRTEEHLVLVCDVKTCSPAMDRLYKEVSRNFGRIGVVTTSKSAEALLERFKEKRIEGRKFQFIDCITSKHKPAQNTAQIKYLSDPRNLTELSIMISQFVEGGIDLLVIDNLSGLLLYNGDLVLTKFLHSIITRLRETSVKSVYPVLKGDFSGVLKDLALFVDAVVES